MLHQLLASNQFASGGLLLMVLGSIMAYLRSIPSKIWDWIMYHCMMTVSIVDESEAYLWFKLWFDQNPRSKRIRHVDVITPRQYAGDRSAVLTPAPGSHWFWYDGRPIRLSFRRSEEKSKGTAERSESLVLGTFGRDRAKLDKLVNEFHNLYLAEMKVKKASLNFWDNGCWLEASFFEPRQPESVVLQSGLMESLIADVEKFQSDIDWYRKTGMPYHRAYLLYGPPGTGKTSTILGVASHFEADVYLLKVSTLSDASLISALSSVGKNAMVILEDVDCVTSKREITENKLYPKEFSYDLQHPEGKLSKKTSEEPKSSFSVTLSGLLNGLDGIETPSGAIFFLTTNDIEKLDSALLRPGRVDRKIHLDLADVDQKRRMYARFFEKARPGDADIFIAEHPEVHTPAEFQEQLKIRRLELETK